MLIVSQNTAFLVLDALAPDAPSGPTIAPVRGG